MYRKPAILLCDYDLSTSGLLDGLPDFSFTVLQPDKPNTVLDFLNRETVDLVILGIRKRKRPDVFLLKEINICFPQVPVIILYEHNYGPTFVDFMKRGASNVLLKPVSHSLFAKAIHQGLMLHPWYCMYITGIKHPEAFSDFVSCNVCMPAIFQAIEGSAEITLPMLITGETGTGKCLMARAIHKINGVKGNMVHVNLAGLNLKQFIYTLGGKPGKYQGLIEQAEGGTLVLDGIEKLNDACQALIFRLVQEGVFFLPGSKLSIPLKARLILIATIDSYELSKPTLLRSDLYYRLMLYHLSIPPLRNRRDDIPLLANLFLRKAAADF